MQKVFNPKVFEDAIDILVTHGWTNAPMQSDIHGKAKKCVWQALQRGYTMNPQLFLMPSVYLGDYDKVLVEHLGVKNVDKVWDLNDSKKNDEGFAWACNVLHELQVKAENALPLHRRLWRSFKKGIRRGRARS